MYIHIDHNSGVPISSQIVDQIKYLAVCGALRGNEKIPSVRGLASQLNLNPTTVARVYRQLEAEEIIFTQRGKGTFIAPRRSGLTQAEKGRRLEGDIRRLVVEAGRLDLDFDDLLTLIRREIEELHEASGGLRDNTAQKGD
ncbi:MAG: GntR family transcriptional regulator [bacterium]